MKRSLLSLAIFATSTTFAAKPESLNTYLEIQEKLASDSFAGVSVLANKIADNEKGSKTEKIAKKLSQSKNIEEARAQFKTLSQEMIASTNKKDLGDLKVASCPMANAKWIQKGTDVKNPYYGSSMLECGSIE